MLAETSKNQLPSIFESFYTPNKGKNPSSIETNPSANVVNSLSPINLISPSVNMSVPLYQYSNIQLSQSLNASPSFMSPSREIGSILTTPDKSSMQFQFKGYPIELKKQESDFRLKTQSIIKVKIDDSRSETEKSRSNKKASPSQIIQFMKMLQIFRAQKLKKQAVLRQLNHQMSKKNFLNKMINEKEEKLLCHKKEVEKKIQRKNALLKKIKVKKMRLKTQQCNQLNRLRTKSNLMSEEFYLNQRKIQLESKHIEILQRQRQSYHQLLRQRSISQQFYPQNYQSQFSFIHHPNQYQYQPFYFQNPQQLNSQINNLNNHSCTNKVYLKYNQNASQPDSSRSKSDFKISTNKNLQKQQPSIMEVLRSHFTKKSTQNESTNEEKNVQMKKSSKSDAFSVKRALHEMVESLSEKSGSPRPQFNQGDKSETQSQIAIEFQSIGNYSDYKLIESNINQVGKKISPKSSPKAKDFINQSHNKFGGAAKEFLQSLVNIMYESSQFSENVFKNHEFASPQLQDQENQQHKKSLNQQVPNKKKNLTVNTTEVKIKESRRKGDETPVFKPSNNDAEQEVSFSRMLLTSLRTQNQEEEQLGSSQANKYNLHEENTRNTLIKIQDDLNFSNRKKRDKIAAFKTIHNESEEQAIIIDDDDEFFSCTLNTESKAVIPLKEQSEEQSKVHEKKTSKPIFLDEQDFYCLAKTSISTIQKMGPGKKTEKIQEKRSSLDLTSKSKISPKFEAVPELDEALEQDIKSRINMKKSTSRRSSKSTL